MKLHRLGLSERLMTFLVAVTQTYSGSDDETILKVVEEADVRRFATEQDMAILAERMTRRKIAFRPPMEGDSVWTVDSLHDHATHHICKTPEVALERLAALESRYTMSHQWAGISKVLLES